MKIIRLFIYSFVCIVCSMLHASEQRIRHDRAAYAAMESTAPLRKQFKHAQGASTDEQLADYEMWKRETSRPVAKLKPQQRVYDRPAVPTMSQRFWNFMQWVYPQDKKPSARELDYEKAYAVREPKRRKSDYLYRNYQTVKGYNRAADQEIKYLKELYEIAERDAKEAKAKADAVFKQRMKVLRNQGLGAEHDRLSALGKELDRDYDIKRKEASNLWGKAFAKILLQTESLLSSPKYRN